VTTSAWIMLGITWTVVASITITFFVMVLRQKD
jgi:hypothetical protein